MNLNPESGLFKPLKEDPFKAIDNAVPEHLLKIDPGMTPDMVQSLIDLSSRGAQTAPPPQIIAQLEKTHIPHEPRKAILFNWEETTHPLQGAKSADAIGGNVGKAVSKVAPTAPRKHPDFEYNGVYCYSSLNYNHDYSKHVPNKQGKLLGVKMLALILLKLLLKDKPFWIQLIFTERNKPIMLDLLKMTKV